jgi:acid phosphatase
MDSPRASISLVSLALLGCTRSPQADAADDLTGVLWMQTAAEYRATCLQTFGAARRALDAALADPKWTAAVEQSDPADKPPAIIVDVDETVLDNTPYNARLIAGGQTFSLDTWAEWVRETSARALPGATAFLDYVASRDVTVFYVTNRAAELEDATRQNLRALGFPLGTDAVDTVLTRNDHDTAGSEKSPRRHRVARTHRVLLMLGDDLGDFLRGARDAPLEERARLVEDYREYWGQRWFVFANPIYGSWLSRLGEDRRAALIMRRP